MSIDPAGLMETYPSTLFFPSRFSLEAPFLFQLTQRWGCQRPLRRAWPCVVWIRGTESGGARARSKRNAVVEKSKDYGKFQGKKLDRISEQRHQNSRISFFRSASSAGAHEQRAAHSRLPCPTQHTEHARLCLLCPARDSQRERRTTSNPSSERERERGVDFVVDVARRLAAKSPSALLLRRPLLLLLVFFFS